MLQAWQRMIESPEDIDGGPSAQEYPGLLGKLFVIESMRKGFAPFRIAGSELSGILGRNLIGTDFLDLWHGTDRLLTEALIIGVTNEDRPGLVRGIGETSQGRRVEIEIAIAPLSNIVTGKNRLLCLYQTLGGEAVLQHRTIWTHRLRSVYPPEPQLKKPNLRLVASRD